MDELREDGRRRTEVRCAHLELGCMSTMQVQSVGQGKDWRQRRALQSPDGSALLKIGLTSVLAAVYGPMEPENKEDKESDSCVIKVEVAQTAFSSRERRRRRRDDPRLVEVEEFVRRATEACVIGEDLPRTQLDITITILVAEGSVLAAAVNAVSAALMQAGVPMRDMMAACSAAVLEGKRKLAVVDTSFGEEGVAAPMLTVVAGARDGMLYSTLGEGRLMVGDYEMLLQTALQGCHALGGFLREQLAQWVQRTAPSCGAVKINDS